MPPSPAPASVPGAGCVVERLGPYDAGVERAVVVPVKAFGSAKARLAAVLDADHRRRLARWSAERVLAAVGELAVFVACDDDEVARWATGHGATVLWHPGAGLNGAVAASRDELRRRGYSHVVVAHADLPLADHLSTVQGTGRAGIVLVPDAHGDGTNVVVVPSDAPFEFSYGAGSFGRHLRAALALGIPVTVRHDPGLSRDLDTPADLMHPMVQEVLPPWLPTNLANRTTPPR